MHNFTPRPRTHGAARDITTMVIALAAITSSVASSQVTGIPTATSLDIRPGDRVRVVAPESGDTARIGTIAAIGDDGIVLRGERRDESLSIPFAHLRQLDVSQGRSAHALAGLGIGLAVGALAGASSFEGSYGPTSLFQSRGTLAAEGALVGAVPGALDQERAAAGVPDADAPVLRAGDDEARVGREEGVGIGRGFWDR